MFIIIFSIGLLLFCSIMAISTIKNKNNPQLLADAIEMPIQYKQFEGMQLLLECNDYLEILPLDYNRNKFDNAKRFSKTIKYSNISLVNTKEKIESSTSIFNTPFFKAENERKQLVRVTYITLVLTDDSKMVFKSTGGYKPFVNKINKNK